MGLDQYASTVDANNNTTELATWRKHPNLQGWMEGLYRARGGEDEFNCVDLELTLADLDMLEGAVKGSDLPSTAGFFFGGDSDEHYKEEDLEFIAKARVELENGNKVFYSSWW